MVGLNIAITLAGAKTLRFGAGIAPGLISGTMTDTAVVGVAQGAIDGGAYQPPANVTAGEVSANIAAAYAITYLLALVAIILLVRFLPARLGGGREGRRPHGGGELRRRRRPPAWGRQRRGPCAKARADEAVGLSVRELSARADVPVLQLLRGTDVHLVRKRAIPDGKRVPVPWLQSPRRRPTGPPSRGRCALGPTPFYLESAAHRPPGPEAMPLV